jgi:hypothetical protein
MFEALFDVFRFLATYLNVEVDVVSREKIEIYPYLAKVKGRGWSSLKRTQGHDGFDYGGHYGS